MLIKIHYYYHTNLRDPYGVELLLVEATYDEQDVFTEDSRVSVTHCHPK